MNTTSTPKHVLMAHRMTGQLRTVPADEAATLGADWFLVCHEPDTEYVATDPLIAPWRVDVYCIYYAGRRAENCPALNDSWRESLRVLPPADWHADDLRHINTVAADLLRDSAIIWRLDTDTKHGKPYTTISLTQGHMSRRDDPQNVGHRHELRLTYRGRPNAHTIAWMAQHATRFAFTAAVGAVDEDVKITPPNMMPEPNKPKR